MTQEPAGEDAFIAAVGRLMELTPCLSPVQAALLVAAGEGIAADSRTFSNRIGVAHALALREINQLADDGSLLTVTRRDPRTLRTFYDIEETGLRLLDQADGLPSPDHVPGVAFPATVC